MTTLKVSLSALLGLTILSRSAEFQDTGDLGSQKMMGTLGQKVMVILLDGFRWDYFDIHAAGLRGFPRMFKSGTRVKYTVPAFPTSSYPNLYTVMTGLHVENHGMVNTYMYDDAHDTYFMAGYNADYNQSYFWDGGDPLWITATRQWKSVYMYYWPNCEVTIRGILPKYCRRFLRMETMEELRTAMTDGLDSLGNQGAELVGIYSELPDYYGHRYGPRSAKMGELVRELDDAIYILLTELEKRHLEDQVNIIIASDYGQTEISIDRVMKVEDYIDVDDVHRFLEGGPLMCIWPKPGRLDKVYNDLRIADHISVYKKADIPDHWHYKHHERIPPLFVSADEGWLMFRPNQTIFYYEDVDVIKSQHGYDNRLQDMRGIFLASGPSFKSSHVSNPIRNVDMYQLMCHILGIEPSTHDGQWAHVEDMLVISAAPVKMSSYWLIVCFAIFGVRFRLAE